MKWLQLAEKNVITFSHLLGVWGKGNCCQLIKDIYQAFLAKCNTENRNHIFFCFCRHINSFWLSRMITNRAPLGSPINIFSVNICKKNQGIPLWLWHFYSQSHKKSLDILGETKALDQMFHSCLLPSIIFIVSTIVPSSLLVSRVLSQDCPAVSSE